MPRGRLLKSLAGGVAVAGLVSVERGRAAAPARRTSKAQDRTILNFALLLEYLKESFYRESLANGALTGDSRRFASVAVEHERAHARALEELLGAHARPRPAFHFGSKTRNQRQFLSTAVALEDLAVAAYNAQAANLTHDAMRAALEIVSVEGRHAAWIRAVAGEEPAPTAADAGEGVDSVAAALRRLHIR